MSQQRPTNGELRIQPHRLSEIFLCRNEVGGIVSRSQTVRQTAQVSVVRFNIIHWFGGDDFLFLTREFRLQLVGDGFGTSARFGRGSLPLGTAIALLIFSLPVGV